MTSTIGAFEITPKQQLDIKVKIDELRFAGGINEVPMHEGYKGGTMTHAYTVDGKFGCTFNYCGWKDDTAEKIKRIHERGLLVFIELCEKEELDATTLDKFLELVMN
jgi:hypothetical protein